MAKKKKLNQVLYWLFIALGAIVLIGGAFVILRNLGVV